MGAALRAKRLDPRRRRRKECAPDRHAAVEPRRRDVLIDLRTYTVRPGTVPAQLALYQKFGYPIQLRYMGEPHFYLTAESGELNTIVHGWVYDSAADRAEKRGRMGQDPEWKVYLSENVKAGNIVAQRTSLMVPAPFAPPIPMPKIHK
jgi:NIPSNAP